MPIISLTHGPEMNEGLLGVLFGQFEQLGPNTPFLTTLVVSIDFLIYGLAS